MTDQTSSSHPTTNLTHSKEHGSSKGRPDVPHFSDCNLLLCKNDTKVTEIQEIAESFAKKKLGFLYGS